MEKKKRASVGAIELTEHEVALLAQIDFEPSPSVHDAEAMRKIGHTALELMRSLIAREAIPEARWLFFTDAAFNIRGHGLSHLQVFEKNGTRGDAIFRHPHFLKYLRYFLYGPDLPASVIEGFEKQVARCGTSNCPRRITRHCSEPAITLPRITLAGELCRSHA